MGQSKVTRAKIGNSLQVKYSKSIAVLVYYLGLVGYKNSEIVPKDFSIKAKPKQLRTLTQDVQNAIMSKFKIAIDKDKVHLDPKLSLQKLANLIGVSETNLSNSINTYYGENFRAVINRKRIEEVQKRDKALFTFT